MITEVLEQEASVEQDELEGQLQDGKDIEWDINDPALASFSTDIDTEAVPEQIKFPPPPDGVHRVRARLSTFRKDGPPVYIKGDRIDGRFANGRVVAWIDCRVVNPETGEEGQFLKTWYPTSIVFKGQTGSQLTALYFLATGKPIKSSTPGAPASLPDIQNAINTLFADAGEAGVEIYVQTRWYWSMPQFVEVVDSEGQPTGLYAYATDESGDRIYDEVKGESKIRKVRALQGIPENKAHLWYDYVAQEERSVQAEVLSLKDPSKFEHN